MGAGAEDPDTSAADGVRAHKRDLIQYSAAGRRREGVFGIATWLMRKPGAGT